MADDWDELAAKGRAARSAEEQHKAELKAEINQLEDERAVKAAAWRLSPLAMQPFRFLMTLPFYTLWGLSVAMAFPYFRYFATGAPVHGSSRDGSRWVLDPTKEGYTLFYPFVLLTALLIAGIVWKRIAWRAGRRRAAEEAAWAQTLPFPVAGYPTAVGAHDHRYKLVVYFVDRAPQSSLADVMKGIEPCVNDTSIGKRSRFTIDYPDGPPPPNAQRFVIAMHAFADVVLVPLHAERPIEHVEVSA